MEHFSIRIIDILDILIVAILLYKIYRMVRGTSVIRVFIGILTFIIVWLIVTFVFKMQLLGAIMDQIVNVGMIGIIVLFQEEIRKWLSMIGSRNIILRYIMKIMPNKNAIANEEILQIVMACKSMSKQKTGALIIIQKQSNLDDIINTGDKINADINSRLIENIFFKNSPLHDGAMIITEKKIAAAACILPLTHNLDIPKELGLRHRAALGLSEKSDAIAIIVSEETGNISIAKDGKFTINITPKDLEEYLADNKTNE